MSDSLHQRSSHIMLMIAQLLLVVDQKADCYINGNT